MKKNDTDKNIEEFEDSLTDSEKEQYNKFSDFSIILHIIFAFSSGLFMGSFGVLLYMFYDLWFKYNLGNVPTPIKTWYENHHPFIYSLIGCIINLITRYCLSLQVVETTSSVWG